LDSEARTYDDKGRPVEIGYGTGETELRVVDHAKLFAELGKEGVASAVLELTRAQREGLAKLAKGGGQLQAELGEARKKRQKGEAGRNKAAEQVRLAEQELAKRKKDGKGEDEVEAAREAVSKAKAQHAQAEASLRALADGAAKAEKRFDEALDAKREALGKVGARPFVMASLYLTVYKQWNPLLWSEHLEALRKPYEADKTRKARVVAARKTLVDL